MAEDFKPEIAELKQLSAPFIREENSTSKIMTHVLISLLPSLALSGIIFGGDALMHVGFCILTSIFWEWLYRLILKKKKTTTDLSAAVTGMLFAYTLPADFPYWKAAVGTFISIVIFKQLFGGIGRNVLNPAVAGRLATYFIFRSSFVYPLPVLLSSDGGHAETSLQSGFDTYGDMMLGRVCGGLGEVSVIAILTGLLYLVAMRVISLHEPLAFAGTVILFSYISGNDGLYQILAGGTLLAAVYFGSDYSTTPMTSLGKLIFGFLAGGIVCTLRFFTPIPEANLVAILIMNLLTLVIDRFIETKPRA